jgi:acetyl esterase/lipase
MRSFTFLLFTLLAMTIAAEPFKKITNVKYAEVEDQTLALDLYLPSTKNSPLIVWIHGGAWRAGSKDFMPLTALVESGYAIASLDYRLTTTAKFPALIHDCKGAIRWLRAHAPEYRYNSELIGIAGNSAGGHMVALIGTSNGNKELEGNVGGNKTQSSYVQAIVSYYGASNLTTILGQSTPHGLNVRVPALKLLLGDTPDKTEALAKLASPVFHVDKNDPPLLLLHGDQDPQMPINQAHELHAAFLAQKLDVHFEVIHGAAHGGKAFYDPERNALVKKFFDRTLKK